MPGLKRASNLNRRQENDKSPRAPSQPKACQRPFQEHSKALQEPQSEDSSALHEEQAHITSTGAPLSAKKIRFREDGRTNGKTQRHPGVWVSKRSATRRDA